MSKQVESCPTDAWPALCEVIASAWEPKPRLSITEIAEEHRMIPSGTAAPGRYRQSVTPWTREIQDRLHPDDDCQVLVYEGAAQASKKSTVGLNWILSVAGGWYPAKMLVAQDTLDNARDFAKDDLDAMIEACDVLKSRVRDSMSRAKNETILGKHFPDGRIRLIGMHSANAVRRMAAKYCWLDELDGAKNNVGYEGNIVALVIGRQTTFGPSRKTYLSSTPTEDGNSEIHDWFLKGDQRYYWLPCPECGEMQPLEFEDPDNRELRYFIWDKGDPLSARYRCRHCGHEFQEDAKNKLLPSGIWVPSQPDNYRKTNLVRSYNLNALYAEIGCLPWPDLASAWDAANAKYRATGDSGDIRTFVNIRKAKVFAPPGQSLDRHVLADRVDETLDPEREVPAAIQAITGGTDVQHECLYSVTLGVGAGFELWILDANRIDRVPEDAWPEHDTLVNRRFNQRESGVIVPRRWAVDAGDGNMMSKVLEYTDPRFGKGVYGIKGDSEKAKDGLIWETKIKGNKRSRTERGRWFTVHVTEAKNDLYNYLTNTSGGGPRTVHIAPSIVQRYPDFLEQLVAEQRQREAGGRWVWVNPKQRPNHWWDALVYALAVAHSLKLAYPYMFRMPTVTVEPRPAVAAPAPQPTETASQPGQIDRHTEAYQSERREASAVEYAPVDDFWANRGG